MDPKKQLEEAAVYSEKKALRGYLLIGPEGQLVLSRPDVLSLAASVERGVYIEGLKDGWKLGSQADVKRKEDEGKKLDAARAHAAKSEAAVK